MTDCISDNRTAPNSHKSLLVFELFNNRVNMVWQVVEQQWINHFIIDVLDFFFGLHFWNFFPFFFHITSSIVLDQLHDLGNPETILSDLNTEFIGCLVLIFVIVAKWTVLEYLFVIVVAEYHVWSDIVYRMLMNFLEDRGIWQGHDWLLIDLLHGLIRFDFVFFILPEPEQPPEVRVDELLPDRGRLDFL